MEPRPNRRRTWYLGLVSTPRLGIQSHDDPLAVVRRYGVREKDTMEHMEGMYLLLGRYLKQYFESSKKDVMTFLYGILSSSYHRLACPPPPYPMQSAERQETFDQDFDHDTHSCCLSMPWSFQLPRTSRRSPVGRQARWSLGTSTPSRCAFLPWILFLLHFLCRRIVVRFLWYKYTRRLFNYNHIVDEALPALIGACLSCETSNTVHTRRCEESPCWNYDV